MEANLHQMYAIIDFMQKIHKQQSLKHCTLIAHYLRKTLRVCFVDLSQTL